MVLPLALEGNITSSVLAMVFLGLGVTAAVGLCGLAASGLTRWAGRSVTSVIAVVGASGIAIGISKVLTA